VSTSSGNNTDVSTGSRMEARSPRTRRNLQENPQISRLPQDSEAAQSLQSLHLQQTPRTAFLSTRNKHRDKHTRNKQTSTIKNKALNKREALLEHIKGEARNYDHESARNTENVEKTQLSKDLYYDRKDNYKLDLF